MSAVLRPAAPAVLGRLRSLFDAHAASSAFTALQAAALAEFLDLGLPTTHDESWKYTNLRRLESRAFGLPEEVAAGAESSTAALTDASWLHCVVTNGVWNATRSTATLPPGVTVRPLRTLAREEPETAAGLLRGSTPDTAARFELLNRAFAADALLIDVAPGAALDRPLALLVEATAAAQPWMVSPRIVVRIGRQARCTLVEQYVSAAGTEHFVNAVTTLTLEPGAQVEHYRLQQEAAQVIHFGTMSAQIGRDAHLVSHTFATGGALGRLNLTARLEEPGANVDLNGVFLADGSRHLDTYTCIEHVEPHTRSREDYRGIADGRGRGVFNGKVIVHPQAQKTDARLSSRNLLLSSTAEIDTRPELEIYADDVKCSHGATTGQLDPAALFYLRSRALSAADARALLALAFVDTVVAGMSLPTVREHVHEFFRSYFLRAGDAP